MRHSEDSSKWAKFNFPFARPMCTVESPLVFQLVGDPYSKILWDRQDATTIVCLSGITHDGAYVRLNITGYNPMLKTTLPVSFIVDRPDVVALEAMRNSLNEQLRIIEEERNSESNYTARWKSKPVVISGLYILESDHTPALCYQVDIPPNLGRLRTLISSGQLKAGNGMPLSNNFVGVDVDYAWQCFVDHKLKLYHWYSIPRYRYTPIANYTIIEPLRSKIVYYDQTQAQCLQDPGKKRPANFDNQPALKRKLLSDIDGIKEDTLSLDIECDINALESVPSPFSDNSPAPTRVASLSIVCESTDAATPDALSNQVFAICMSIHLLGEAQRKARTLSEDVRYRASPEYSDEDNALLRSKLNHLMTSIPDRDGHCIIFYTNNADASQIKSRNPVTCIRCDNEKAMLLEFASFLRWMGPLMITGWGITKIAMPYLIDRASALGIFDQFCSSSVEGKPLTMKKAVAVDKKQQEAAAAAEAKEKKKNQSVVAKLPPKKKVAGPMMKGTPDYWNKKELTTLWHPSLVFIDGMQIEMQNGFSGDLSLATALKKFTHVKDYVPLSYQQITDMFNGTPEQRGQLLDYCQNEQRLAYHIEYMRMHVHLAISNARQTNASLFAMLNKSRLSRTYQAVAQGKHMGAKVKNSTSVGPIDIMLAKMNATHHTKKR